MTLSTLSSKYQIVIPKEVRNRLHLKAGQKMFMMPMGDAIYMVPERPLSYLRGRFKGQKIDMSDIREKKDRDV